MKLLSVIIPITLVAAFMFSCSGPQAPKAGENFYEINHDYFMKDGYAIEASFIRVLTEKKGLEDAESLAEKVTADFEVLLPNIPYYGHDNKFLSSLISAAYCLPLIDELEARGYEHYEIGEIIYLGAEDFFQRNIPDFVAWYIRSFMMTPDHAKEEQEKLKNREFYPGDWQSEFVSAEGDEYDFGRNFTQCGIVEFYKQYDRLDYVRYICLCDYAKFKRFGVELIRTQTIGNGDPICDFRFKVKNSKPKDGWPPESNPEYKSEVLSNLRKREEEEAEKIACGGHICIGCGLCIS